MYAGRTATPAPANLAAERFQDRAAENAVLALLLSEAAARAGLVLEAERGALECEALEHAGGHVLVDHPTAPRRLRRGGERGEVRERGESG